MSDRDIVLNDPVNFVDVDGLWPTSIHNDIIDKAFPNLPSNYRDAIKRGSKYTDTFQSGADSYMHAMRNRDANQSKADACKQMNDYIDAHMQKYRDYLKNGQNMDAYFQLGMALHPVMDSTAPPHKGFQPWGNILHIPIITLISHWRGESSINNQQINQTVNIMNRVLNNNGL